MQKTDSILSVTGKELGAIFKSGNIFCFQHFVADEFQGGFNTWIDAYNAFHNFHDEWFENQ